MFVSPRNTRRNPVRNLASALALALAVTGGAAVTNAAFAPAVAAQEYSDEFVDAYSPVADVVNAEDGDVASIAGQFATIVSLIQSDDERNAAGNLILTAGNKTGTIAWQRQGLELMLASGMVPPEAVGQYQWFVGNLAFQMEDFAASRAALQAAADAGWTNDDPTGLIAETYFQQDDYTGGLNYILGMVQQREASGGEVATQWLLRGLQTAYGEDMTAEANQLALALVRHHPSQTNWMNALQVVNALNEMDAKIRLDLLRLMRVTDTLTARGEFVRYIEAADPRIMSNEVVGVLNAGLAAGEFDADETYYIEVNGIVQERMADDRADADEYYAEGLADTSLALSAGDLLFSIEDFARAEELYAAAVDGGDDRDAALTRLGMVQLRQGKLDEGKATLEQVGGDRVMVAQFWIAYANSLAS